MWNTDKKIDLKEDPRLREELLDKVKFLKDSDFKVMHNRKLPVTQEDE
jgi:hypothetical protein